MYAELVEKFKEAESESYNNELLSNYCAPREDPILRKEGKHCWYPGPKYSGDACVVDPLTEMVYEIKLDQKEGKSYQDKLMDSTILYEDPKNNIEEEMTIREYLKMRDVDKILPVVGYGSNRDPKQMTHKFTKESLKKAEESSGIKFDYDEYMAYRDPIIMVKGKSNAVDVVYAAAISRDYQQVYAFAIPTEKTDTETECWITFITEKQLRPLHASEHVYSAKKDYDVVEMPTVKTNIGDIDALGYAKAGKVNMLVDDEGNLIRYKSVESINSRIKVEKDQEEVLKQIVDWINKDLGYNFDTIEEFQEALTDDNLLEQVKDYLVKEHSKEFELEKTYKEVENPDNPIERYIRI